MTFSFGQIWKWLLAIVAVVLVGWLWVSWLNGGFISAGPIGTKPLTPQQQKEVLDSLTAPTSGQNNAGAPQTPEVKAALKGLTAPTTNNAGNASSSVTSPTVSPAILDSLSAPKK